jgi:hypothetical protein
MAATTLDKSGDIPTGMPVYTADARRLGVVTAADPYGLVVEEGSVSRHSYALSRRDVARVEDGALHLVLPLAEMREPTATR